VCSGERSAGIVKKSGDTARSTGIVKKGGDTSAKREASNKKPHKLSNAFDDFIASKQ
jgi:hypothetical protein